MQNKNALSSADHIICIYSFFEIRRKIPKTTNILRKSKSAPAITIL
jgi:hypothetical protein